MQVSIHAGVGAWVLYGGEPEDWRDWYLVNMIANDQAQADMRDEQERRAKQGRAA